MSEVSDFERSDKTQDMQWQMHEQAVQETEHETSVEVDAAYVAQA